MNKSELSYMVQPTNEELLMYKKLLKDIGEEQLDEFANEYFNLVQEEKINVSFPRFIIDKIIRPIREGDTIQIETDNNEIVTLFCLIRKRINKKDYLLFSKVDEETETLFHDSVYLFYVDGTDENGTEVIEIMANGNEADKILDLIEMEVVDAELDKENFEKG